MLRTKGYAAMEAGAKFQPFTFERRSVGPRDVLLEIRYCGICHSDIHQARDEWGGAIFPMVPGHEIVGTAVQVGSAVNSIREGDTVGVGCFVDSCRTCPSCKRGLEQYCDKGMILTYNGLDKNGDPTYGGYSKQIVVDEQYLLKIPNNLSLDGTAPLLCAGITVYSPFRLWGVGKGHKLAVVGLGGLGHMGVKIGRTLGAEVTVLSHSPNKQKDAERLGATDFVLSTDEETVSGLSQRFDFILDTVSAPHTADGHLGMLKTDGTLILVGAPNLPTTVGAFSLISNRRRMVGSLIGGIQETQEMLDFCADHGITSEIEVIPMQKVDEAYERVINGDVRFRFVIDLESLP